MRRPFAFAALCAALVLSLVTGAPGRAQPGKKAGEKPARVVVYLPEEADLFVEGTRCPLKSARRAFNTAPLEPGKRYEYTLRAEIAKGDTKVGVTLTALVRAGETTEVRFGDEKSFLAAGGLAKLEAQPKDKHPEPKVDSKAGAPRPPAPWVLDARIDSDGDLAYKYPGSQNTEYLSAGTFAVFTADGKAVTPRAARERLSRDVTLFVTADAKPLDPYYAALLAPTAVVVVPQKAFRGEAAPVLRGVLFGQASASDGALRVRFAGGSATRTRDETNASTFGRVRVSRGTASEQVLELSLSAVRGYDGTDRMTQTELAAALATEGPFVLTENGRAPDAALTRALKPGTRVLVLPVPFREP
jgi:uncharacterized protein (TIGR03000 family)